MNRIVSLQMRPQRASSPLLPYKNKTKSVTQKRALTQPYWHPDLILATISVVYKPFSLWYFVRAA